MSNAIIMLFTLPYFFADALWILASTRFFIGVCSAVIINATAAYVGEAIPTEYLVYSGTCINTGLVFGIEITTLFNLSLPYWSDDEPVPEEAKTTDLWRISYSL